MGVYYLQNSDHDAVFNLSVSEMDILNERRDYVLDHSHEEHVDGHGSDQDGMGMGLFGFLFISLLLIVSLVISFRWCCKRMRQYNEFVRGIEEEHERRRQVEEDLWIFTIQQEHQPRIRYGDSTQPRSRPPTENSNQKPPDELPSYEEAIKLPPIYAKDTTSHV